MWGGGAGREHVWGVGAGHGHVGGGGWEHGGGNMTVSTIIVDVVVQ